MAEKLSFKSTEIAQKIDAQRRKLIQLYTKNDFIDEVQSLKEQLAQAASGNNIRIVFIGQYTAGKSSIISALASVNDIKIDSDVATTETADYDWNGLTLTDTPGLYTGNQEHDDKTINMIRNADLLVYCITSDLFNQFTKEDFINWAFEKNYVGKMFLVINKMSKEAGDYSILVRNYTESINRALIPHSISEFSYSFLDTKDYKVGLADHDLELIAESHFEDFIRKLNSFIDQKGLLGKMDTPIMILKASIDGMMQKLSLDDSDRAYQALCSRIEKKVDWRRNQLSKDSHAIVTRGLRPIINKGYELSRLIGTKKIDSPEEEVKELIEKTCNQINNELSDLCAASIQQLNDDVIEVLNSEAASYFFNTVSSHYDGKKHFFENQQTKANRVRFDTINSIVSDLSGKVVNLATKKGANAAGFFLKAAESSGSKLHHLILNIGKAFGHKFKPWQAVKIAKNIGNVAKFIGPVLEVVGLAIDIKETVDEQALPAKIQQAQNECRQNFRDIAAGIEEEYNKEMDNAYAVYNEISAKIRESREKVQEVVQRNSGMTAELNDIRNELISIQGEIF